ncbi:MAG TPA: hypothetical protein VLC09_13415, partial [Polyangiaceae bacterium]|nr:hypothetical protein [Polyangiaceae bacterium]
MSDQAPKVVLSLEALYSSVVAEFKDEKIDVPNLFGWRTPPQKIVTGPRITWVPGDLNGDLGAIGAPKYPGRHPRPLATLAELVTVTITGFDETEPEDEFAQYKATRHLLDTWFRAVYHAAFGTFEVRKSGWVIDKKERRHGASIRVLLALDSKMSDRA